MAPTDGSSHGERLKQLLRSDGPLRPDESAEVEAIIMEVTKITKGVLMKYGADELTAEEISGIAIERGITFIRQYESAKAKFSTWVAKIALNLLTDKRRKHLLPDTGFSDVEVSDLGKGDDNIEEILNPRNSNVPDFLQVILDSLSETDRSIIIYSIKYSDALYMEHFDISDDAFRQRKSRAFRNFKKAYIRINSSTPQSSANYLTKTRIRD